MADAFGFLLSPQGRVTRKTFWLKFALPYTGLYFLALIIDVIIGTFSKDIGLGLLSGIVSVLLLYPSVVMCIKRLHDRNRSGWFYLLLFIPIVNLWPTIEIYFLRGTRGPNRFGPESLGQQA